MSKFESEFEELFDMTEVHRLLFVALYRDNKNPRKYFITIDGNFMRAFYADSDDEAIDIFYDKRNKEVD